MEGTTLHKALHQAVDRGCHLLLLPGGWVHFPVHDGQAALHIVNGQQSKGCHVLLIEDNSMMHLKSKGL